MGHTEVVSALQLVSDRWEIDTKTYAQGKWAESEAKILINAARTGNLSVVTTLRSVCSPNTSIPDVETWAADPPDLSNAMVGARALMQAIHGGHQDVVAHLLYHGVSTNIRVPWRLFKFDQDGFDDFKDFNDFKDLVMVEKKTVETQVGASRGPNTSAKLAGIGCFALHLAIAHNKREIVKLLLRADVDPEAGIDVLETKVDVEGKWISPLAYASAIGNIEIAQDLLEYGANIEGQSVSSATREGLRSRHAKPRIGTPDIPAALYVVSHERRSFVTEEELRFRYTTPLIQAAGEGHLSMMEHLLNAGADIDNYDSTRNAPLSVAAAEGHLEATRLLIQKGASLGQDTPPEKIPLVSPVVEAIKWGNIEILKLLLEAGADLKTSIYNDSAVIVAVGKRNLEAAELLLKHGADANVAKDVWTEQRWRSIPLCRAIELNDRPMVELLLSYGADPLCSAGWGSLVTPLQIAQQNAHFSASEIVISFHKRQLEASANGSMDGSTESGISLEARLDLHSGPAMDTTNMVPAREADLNSESESESSALSRICGADLSLGSSIESLTVDT